MTNERTYWGIRERRAVEQRDLAYAALKDAEWSFDDDGRGDLCPKCFEWKPQGHTDDCTLGNAIKAIEQDTLWPISKPGPENAKCEHAIQPCWLSTCMRVTVLVDPKFLEAENELPA